MHLCLHRSFIVQLHLQKKYKMETRWRPVWQPCCEHRENFAGFRMFFFFFFFYVLDVVSITVYDRHMLLNIGSSVAQRKPDFEFLNACSQTRHQNPLSGLHDWGNAGGKEGRELASSSDWDAVLSDLLFQPFCCWLTFSHWTTNSANCGRTSYTNEKQGTAALFASQKPGCLQWFQTQPSSSRASPCTARTEGKSSQGKVEVEAFDSISTTCGVMKGTYTLLNPSAPLIWNFIWFCVDHSGYRGNLQRS